MVAWSLKLRPATFVGFRKNCPRFPLECEVSWLAHSGLPAGVWRGLDLYVSHVFVYVPVIFFAGKSV